MRRASLLDLQVSQTIILGRKRLDRRDTAANPTGIIPGRQHRYRRLHKIGITEVLSAIGKRMLHDVGEQVQMGRGIVRKFAQLITFEHIQHLNDRDPARARRRHRDHGPFAIVPNERLAPDGLITFEIVERHYAALFLERLRDRLGNPSLIEDNLAEWAREVTRRDFILGHKNTRQLWKPFHRCLLAFDGITQSALHRKAVCGVTNGPGHDHR